jgi:hypothetical protein
VWLWIVVISGIILLKREGGRVGVLEELMHFLSFQLSLMVWMRVCIICFVEGFLVVFLLLDYWVYTQLHRQVT